MGSDYQLTSNDISEMLKGGNSTGNGSIAGAVVGNSLNSDTIAHMLTNGGNTGSVASGPSFQASQWGNSIDPSSSLPISGPVTQGYGATDFAQSNKQIYKSGFHNGVDIGVPDGTSIPDPVGGTVAQVGDMGNTAYGKYIVIKGTDGINRLYGHLSQQDVQPGQTISAGSVIGLSGQTGDATGPHLHYSEFTSK